MIEVLLVMAVGGFLGPRFMPLSMRLEASILFSLTRFLRRLPTCVLWCVLWCGVSDPFRGLYTHPHNMQVWQRQNTTIRGRIRITTRNLYADHEDSIKTLIALRLFVFPIVSIFNLPSVIKSRIEEAKSRLNRPSSSLYSMI